MFPQSSDAGGTSLTLRKISQVGCSRQIAEKKQLYDLQKLSGNTPTVCGNFGRTAENKLLKRAIRVFGYPSEVPRNVTWPIELEKRRTMELTVPGGWRHLVAIRSRTKKVVRSGGMTTQDLGCQSWFLNLLMLRSPYATFDFTRWGSGLISVLATITAP